METFVVTRQIFAVGKKDAFHLQLEYAYENKKVFITSSIPDWVLDQYPFPELTLKEQKPFLDMNEVNQKLTEYARTLKTCKMARQFFYSSLLLDENGNFIQEKSHFYRRMVSTFLFKKIPYTSIHTKPFSALFLTECFKNAVSKESDFLQVKSIKRKTFEYNLKETLHEDEYTDLYFRIKSFVQIKVTDLRANMPSFIAGINEKNEVVIAFVRHSLQLHDE